MATDRRRNEDVIARSSFNQFRVLLPGVDENGAQVVMTKIRQSVMGEDFVYRGNKLKVDMVISAITKREEDLQLQQMLQESEIALLKEKEKQLKTDSACNNQLKPGCGIPDSMQ